MLVQEKDITILNWGKAYDETEKKLITKITNLTIVNSSLSIENEQLCKKNETLISEINHYKKEISTLQK